MEKHIDAHISYTKDLQLYFGSRNNHMFLFSQNFPIVNLLLTGLREIINESIVFFCFRLWKRGPECLQGIGHELVGDLETKLSQRTKKSTAIPIYQLLLMMKIYFFHQKFTNLFLTQLSSKRKDRV